MTRELGFVHVNLDSWDREGVSPEGIDLNWWQFYDQDDIEPFCRAVRGELTESPARGAVVTFASVWLPSPRHLDELEQRGLTPIILVGPLDQLREAFSVRERELGTNRSLQHWDESNLHIAEMLDDPGYDRYRLDVFRVGRRVSEDSLVAEVKTLLAAAR